MNIKYGKQDLFSPQKIIAVGDIHGMDLKLDSLLQKILPLESETHLVFCGDVINRGTNSARVLDMITEVYEKFPGQVFVVRGNHDWMLHNYCLSGSNQWLSFLTTSLEQMKTEWSLSDTKPDTIKQALIDQGIWNWYFDHALPYYETDEVICTHAPIDYMTVYLHGGKDYAEDYLQKDTEDGDGIYFKYMLERLGSELLWMFTNEDEKRIDNLIPKFKICGHQFKHHSQPRIFKQRAYIDTGCGCIPNRPLTALIYPGKKVVQSE